MLTLKYTARFKKDYKLAKKRNSFNAMPDSAFIESSTSFI